MVKFVGVYQLPSPIAVTPSVLSKSFRAIIAGRSARLKTPGVSWSEDDRPSLVPPSVDHLPTHRGQGIHPAGGPSWEYGVPWGQVSPWTPSKQEFPAAWVKSVALQFTLPAGSFEYLDTTNVLGPPHGGTVAELFGNVDSWLLDLLLWVGVARDHDTDHLEPLSLSTVPGQGLAVRSIESDGRVSSLAGASTMTITQSRTEAINLGTLRTILRLVNGGAQPHESHLLLREAHIARRRGKRRRAVIDAGTATELVLAQWNVHSNGNKQPPPGRFKTLGWYVHEAKAIVPNYTMAGLVKIRNDAVHSNLVPTHVQVVEALSIADAIVNAIEPLPL